MKSFLVVLSIILLSATAFLLGRTVVDVDDKNRSGSQQLRIQLQWFDGAQFMGFYVAKAKGYYRDEGLQNVDLIPLPGYTASPITLLQEGQADIAIATADQVLISATKENDIKVVGTVFNRSLARFMYKKNNFNNMNLWELKNKKIAVYKNFDTENILKALDKKHHLNLNYETDVLPAGAIEAFQNNEIDLWGSYINNEPESMKIQGIEVGLLDPEEYGIEFYSDTVITTSNYLKDNREVVKKFLKASSKGWQYAKDYPQESIDIMFELIKNITKDEHMNKELASLKILSNYLGSGPNNKIFYMDKNRWLIMEKNLHIIGALPREGYIDRLCDFNIINEY